MTGIEFGQFILALVGAAIVVAIVVWLLNWLYLRSSKERAFVRTGFGGQKVVMNGGALVLPIIHEVIPVNMNTLRLEVSRGRERALITKDRMRVDVTSEFYVRVQASADAIAAAAQTLGQRTMQPDMLKELVEGKFVDALRTVAAEMTMEEMHEKRGEYVKRVRNAAAADLLQNGLELETVSLTQLDQTAMEFFNQSKAQSEAQAAADQARAKAVAEEEKVFTVREVELAQRKKLVDVSNAEAEADTSRIRSLAAKIRHEVEAEGLTLMNKAANLLTPEARQSAMRRQLIDKLEGIIRESVKPMERIEGIRVLHVEGLGGGQSASGNGGGANIADSVGNSALRFRAQAPLVDQLLREIGVQGGDIGLAANTLLESGKKSGSEPDFPRP